MLIFLLFDCRLEMLMKKLEKPPKQHWQCWLRSSMSLVQIWLESPKLSWQMPVMMSSCLTSTRYSFTVQLKGCWLLRISLMCTLSWVQISSGEWWRCGFPFTCHKWNFHLPSWPPLLSKGAFHLSELSGQTMAGAVILTMKKAFPMSFGWKTISFLLMISKILITTGMVWPVSTDKWKVPYANALFLFLSWNNTSWQQPLSNRINYLFLRGC